MSILTSSIRARLSRSPIIQAARDLPLRLNPPVSFSQHGEDIYISEKILGSRVQSGVYVDIGASHPARLSNTYFFYRQGWRGLVVEPIRALLDQHRKWRPQDVHAQCLIGEHDGETEFYQLYPSVLSTTSKLELAERLKTGSRLLRRDVLPALTLTTILTRYLPDHTIDIMSVDVEGIDVVVGKQVSELPLASRPRILCIETNSPEAELEMRQILASVYGRVHLLGCNLIFWDLKSGPEAV